MLGPRNQLQSLKGIPGMARITGLARFFFEPGARSHPLFWLVLGSPVSKIDYRKKVGGLVLCSLLEDLVFQGKAMGSPKTAYSSTAS